jgi:hypothetical protein
MMMRPGRWAVDAEFLIVPPLTAIPPRAVAIDRPYGSGASSSGTRIL